MFVLFFTLYYSMFVGSWTNTSLNNINTILKSVFNKLGELLTNTFNGTTTSVTDLGEVLLATPNGYVSYLALVAFVLALITSIGIVVMAVKGVKKAFGIFFGQIR